MVALVERNLGSWFVGAAVSVVLGCSGSTSQGTAPDAGGAGGAGSGNGGNANGGSGNGGSSGKGTGGLVSSTGGAGGSVSGAGGSVATGGSAGGLGCSLGGGGGGGMAGANLGGFSGGYSFTIPGPGLNDRMHDVAVDSQGNAIAVGGVDGAVSLASTDYAGGILIVKLDPTGNLQWGEVFGEPYYDTEGRGVAVAADDSFVVAGAYRRPVTFGNTTLTLVDDLGGPDAFVVKFDADGNALWAKGFGSMPYDVAADVALDACGNVYVTGWVSGSIDFGGGLRETSTESPFVLKLDAAGNHVYSQIYPCMGDGVNGVYSAGSSIGVDAAGNVLLSGYFKGSLNFGGSALSRTGDDIGAFLVRLDSMGSHTFSTAFGNAGFHFGNAVLVHPDGSLLLAGTAVGTVDFGGGVHGQPYPGDANGELFAARFTAGAALQWSTTVDDPTDVDGFAAAMDPAGNYYVAGNTTPAASYYGEPLLVTIDPSGAVVEQRPFDADGTFSGLTVDGSGSIYAAGQFASSADFGFGALSGENDVVVVKLARQ